MSATLINLPPPQLQSAYSESSSGPGTPMSGVSTTAIKDGHEGTRPNADGISAADRILRLGLGAGYFDQPQIPRSTSYTPTPVLTPAPTPVFTSGGLTPVDKGESPASTVTTEEALRATREAKLIDGMTYDEGVVDTTDRSPVSVVVRKEKEKRKRGLESEGEKGEEEKGEEEKGEEEKGEEEKGEEKGEGERMRL